MLPVNDYYDDILKLLAATGTRWTPTLPLAFGLIPEASPLRTAMLGTVKRAYRAVVQLLTCVSRGSRPHLRDARAFPRTLQAGGDTRTQDEVAARRLPYSPSAA